MRETTANFDTEKNKLKGAQIRSLVEIDTQANGTLYFSDQPLTVSGQAYLAQAKELAPIISQYTPGEKTPRVGSWGVVLRNKNLYSNQIRPGDRVRYFMWFGNLEVDDKQLLFEGTVNKNIGGSWYDFSFAADDISAKYDKLLGRLATRELFPDIDPTDMGRVIPLVYGDVKNHRGLITKSPPVTTLADDIDATTTSPIQVTDVSRFTDGAATAIIGDEETTFTDTLIDSNGDHWIQGTIVRGTGGTTATTHSRGDPVIEKTSMEITFADHEVAGMTNMRVKPFAHPLPDAVHIHDLVSSIDLIAAKAIFDDPVAIFQRVAKFISQQPAALDDAGTGHNHAPATDLNVAKFLDTWQVVVDDGNHTLTNQYNIYDGSLDTKTRFTQNAANPDYDFDLKRSFPFAENGAVVRARPRINWDSSNTITTVFADLYLGGTYKETKNFSGTSGNEVFAWQVTSWAELIQSNTRIFISLGDFGGVGRWLDFHEVWWDVEYSPNDTDKKVNVATTGATEVQLSGDDIVALLGGDLIGDIEGHPDDNDGYYTSHAITRNKIEKFGDVIFHLLDKYSNIKNLIQNGNFEKGFRFWDNGSATINTSSVNSKTNSARLVSTGSTATGPTSDAYVIDATKMYWVGISYNIPSYTAGDFFVNVRFYDDEAGTSFISAETIILKSAVTPSWEKSIVTIGPATLSPDFDIPPTTLSIKIQSGHVTSPTMSTRIDDVRVEQVSFIDREFPRLLNPGLETLTFQHWTAGSATLVTGSPNTGLRSARLLSTGASLTGPTSDPYVVDEIKKYWIGSSHRVNAYTAGNHILNVKCYSDDAGTAFLSNLEIINISSLTAGWWKDTTTVGPSSLNPDFNFPANTASIRFEFRHITSPTMDSRIDDITIGRDSFSIAQAVLPDSYRFAFAVIEQIGLMELINKLAWQCGCRFFFEGGKVKLSYIKSIADLPNKDVKNIGFDDNFSFWTAGSASINPNQSVTGANSARLNSSGANLTGPTSYPYQVDIAKKYQIESNHKITEHTDGRQLLNIRQYSDSAGTAQVALDEIFTVNGVTNGWVRPVTTIGPAGSDADIIFNALTVSARLEMRHLDTPTLKGYMDNPIISTYPAPDKAVNSTTDGILSKNRRLQVEFEQQPLRDIINDVSLKYNLDLTAGGWDDPNAYQDNSRQVSQESIDIYQTREKAFNAFAIGNNLDMAVSVRNKLLDRFKWPYKRYIMVVWLKHVELERADSIELTCPQLLLADRLMEVIATNYTPPVPIRSKGPVLEIEAIDMFCQG